MTARPSFSQALFSTGTYSPPALIIPLSLTSTVKRPLFGAACLDNVVDTHPAVITMTITPE